MKRATCARVALFYLLLWRLLVKRNFWKGGDPGSHSTDRGSGEIMGIDDRWRAYLPDKARRRVIFYCLDVVGCRFKL